MKALFDQILNGEITEAYDAVEHLLRLPLVEENAGLHKEISTALNALFRARTLTDGSDEGGFEHTFALDPTRRGEFGAALRRIAE